MTLEQRKLFSWAINYGNQRMHELQMQMLLIEKFGGAAAADPEFFDAGDENKNLRHNNSLMEDYKETKEFLYRLKEMWDKYHDQQEEEALKSFLKNMTK